MASPSVGESQHSHKLAQDAQKGRGRFGWLRSRRDDVEPAPFFAEPAPTQTLTRVPAGTQSPPRHTHPPAVHRDPSTNPDPVALHISELCIQAVRQGWSSTHLDDVLANPLGALRKRAAREREGGEAIARRAERNLGEAERMAAGLAAADAVGVLGGIDPVALGKTIAARAVQARTPDAPTGLLPVITDDMPDPRTTGPELAVKSEEPGTVVLTVVSGVPSPVHPNGDGTAPPMPDEAPASGEALPRREPKPAADTEQAEAGEPR